MTTTEQPSLSIAEFCKLEGFGTTLYYNLRKRGLGPKEIRIPGTRFISITHGARIEWQQAMTAFAGSSEARKESARRSQQAAKAVDTAFKKGTHRRMPKKPRD